MTGKLRQYHPLLSSALQVFEALLGFLTLSVCYLFYYGRTLAHDYVILALGIFSISLITFNLVGAYRSWRGTHFFAEAKAMILGCLLVYGTLILLGFVFKKTHDYSRMVMGLWALSWPMVLIAERYILRKLMRTMRKRGYNFRTAVIIGAGDLGRKVCHWLDRNRWTGIQVLGFFDDDHKNPVRGKAVLADISDAADYVSRNKVDLVYLALPLRAEDKVKQTVAQIANTTASVYFIPDIFAFNLLLSGTPTSMGDITAISLWDSPLLGFNTALKRALDVMVATVILVLISPILLVTALAIKLDSKGPVFFKQWRYGIKGEPIYVWKFRTMTVCEDGYEFKQATQDDCRVTRVGKFLRKTSIDELPQFFNVLGGSMSVVGPRPHPVAMNEQYRSMVAGYMLRHTVKPGITGLAQINGFRGETDTVDKMEKRIRYDLEYLRNWSPWLDLKIMLKTVPSCVFSKQAY